MFVSLLLAFLTSCMSTNQFASRKYTKGHFSDPIAKVNVDFVPSGTNTAAETVKPCTVSQGLNSPKVSTTVSEIPLKSTPKQVITITNKQNQGYKTITNIAAGNGITKSNISSSENSVLAVTDQGGSGWNEHTYLRYAIICLIVAVIATILLAVILFVLFDIIAGIAWLGFIVFLILWLVAHLGGI
jgi:hypothetical protein